MKDATLSLLLDNLTDRDDTSSHQLFIADENINDNNVLMQFAAAMPLITNRYHIFSAIKQTGSNHQFSDFDFSNIHDASLQRIYYRTSKEKPVVHHIINSASRILKTGGELIIAGEKQQGIQTYIKKSEQCLCSSASIKKDGAARIGIIQKKNIGEPLDDNDYTTLRPAITIDDIVFYSKPGVFGWDKIDQGSQFLAHHLNILSIEKTRLLDLGCGYGYLSVMAHQYSPLLIHATDNNAAALLACKKNFELHNISGEVIADHIGKSLTPGYDIILCNPPFHQGFDIEHSMTEDFIVTCAHLLAKHGHALFVVNSFIALEKIANRYFYEVKVIANNNKFKVILLGEKKTKLFNLA